MTDDQFQMTNLPAVRQVTNDKLQMTNVNPKVSVIIPVYNREHLIQRAINSVLYQTYSNLEVIVVNDASSDGTEEKVKEIKDDRIKYFKNEENLGPSVSRNKGIKFSNGELIAFQDSDDEWYKDKLEKQVRLLVNSPDNVGAVYCGMELFDYKTGEFIKERRWNVNFKENFKNGSFILSPSNVSVLIKKTVIEEIGLFDERLYGAEDTEISIRISKKYNYALVDENLVRVTKNHDQLSRINKNYIFAHEIIYKKYKDFLGKKILFGLCKEIANYYILNKDFRKAKEYAGNALNYRKDISTLFQNVLLNTLPYFLFFLYKIKYNDKKIAVSKKQN